MTYCRVVEWRAGSVEVVTVVREMRSDAKIRIIFGDVAIDARSWDGVSDVELAGAEGEFFGAGTGEGVEINSVKCHLRAVPVVRIFGGLEDLVMLPIFKCEWSVVD